ncbi:MAG TPA: GspMb/PilO family protein [Burkholderiales bacterium]|nr:GspMb/PilO family protein [Burkholderiales bacterium]
MSAAGFLRRVCHELGTMGLASIAIIAGAILFLFTMLKPLEARNVELQHEIALNARQNASTDANLVRTSTPAAKMAAFYHFLSTDRPMTEWLGRLYAAGQAAGVELQSADYRMQKTGTRIERYQIRIPLRGNYAQIRGFLDNALVDIPVLSLDEVKFKRERASDAQIEAELLLSLHLVNP